MRIRLFGEAAKSVSQIDKSNRYHSRIRAIPFSSGLQVTRNHAAASLGRGGNSASFFDIGLNRLAEASYFLHRPPLPLRFVRLYSCHICCACHVRLLSFLRAAAKQDNQPFPVPAR